MDTLFILEMNWHSIFRLTKDKLAVDNMPIPNKQSKNELSILSVMATNRKKNVLNRNSQVICHSFKFIYTLTMQNVKLKYQLFSHILYSYIPLNWCLRGKVDALQPIQLPVSWKKVMVFVSDAVFLATKWASAIGQRHKSESRWN